MKRSAVRSSERGIASIYLMVLLTTTTTGILSLMNMQGLSQNENMFEANRSVARTMALSGLHEGSFYVQKSNPGWSGTTSEQLIDSNGKPGGSYEYSVTKLGDVFTINSTGYFPQKNSDPSYRTSVTLTKVFTINTNKSPKGLVLIGAAGTTFMGNANALLNMPLGNLLIASKTSNAMNLNSNVQITAKEIYIAGGYNKAGNAKINATIESGYSNAISDPYHSIPEPDPSSYPVEMPGAFDLNSNKSATLYAGVYKGPITLNSNTNTTLMPGIYILEGGMNVNSNANVIGTDVMLFNTGASAFIMSSNATISISAPTTGPYQGIAFFQSRTSTTPVTINSNAGSGFGGVVYAPGAELIVNSNGTVVMKGEANVFRALLLNSNANVSVSPDIATTVPLL